MANAIRLYYVLILLTVTISKIEANKVTLNNNNFDLYDLLNSLLEILSIKARSKGLQLNLNCDRLIDKLRSL